MEESFPMTGGDGPYSYAKNSNPQKEAAETAKAMLVAAITENLDIKQNLCPVSNSFRIADFGCSTGPNTFIAIDTIIEAVSKTYQIKYSHDDSLTLPEFHVYFSDHVSNDFNFLFANLPKERRYFAASAPGSFHDRLFPRASLNFAYSSHALQWLSRVPRELGDSSSPAYNKGRIFYANAGKEVGEAYRHQHQEDMEKFLGARAEELAPGGLMVILMSGREDGTSPVQSSLAPLFEPLESSLVDMANEGLISHEKIDSFNLPIFSPSPEEIRRIVHKNGCFEILRLEEQPRKLRPLVTPEECRAGFESIIKSQFGDQIIEQLFNRYSKKIAVRSPISADDGSIAIGLFLMLKRNLE
ncbi:SAM dependent carboxyl methyltransferase [Trema orientale]|uniref:SAM dependent carboxyl methyltransferase n=1 Tax=Trema orientale TaxID=63057 RepID=A0A2P5E9T6_TREOI|nr:SAM dependent carboxyl methyltransferase [Trema orientale]